jgi:hypothetical protein
MTVSLFLLPSLFVVVAADDAVVVSFLCNLFFEHYSMLQQQSV